jgi:hypothetical protein
LHNENEALKVRIFKNNGQLLFEVTGNKTDILKSLEGKLKKYAKGLYILEFYYQKKSYYQKLIKQ